MRFVLLAILLLVACSPEAAPVDPATANYAGTGRNRLCIAGDGKARRAGFIVYGEGDENCSASGHLEGGALVPRGDGDCRIALEAVAGGFRIASLPAACAYYCGPGVSASDTFRKQSSAAPITDLAGDPLC